MISHKNPSVTLYVDYKKSLSIDTSDLKGLIMSQDKPLYPTKEFVDFNIMYMFSLLCMLLFHNLPSQKYVKSTKIIARMFLVFNTSEMITDEREDLVTVFSSSLDRLQQDTHTNTDINNVKAATDRLIKKILEILETPEKVALKNQLLFILRNIRSVSR